MTVVAGAAGTLVIYLFSLKNLIHLPQCRRICNCNRRRMCRHDGIVAGAAAGAGVAAVVPPMVSAYKFPAKSVHTTTSIPQSERNNYIHSAARAVLVSG